MIRVLIVDDQHLVRAGLRMLCASTEDIEVVGEAAGGGEAVELAARLLPDVVMMDLRMPGMNGTVATRQILAARPVTRVVVLTTFDDDDHLYPALAAGACGFLAKDVPPDLLLDAVRRAADGDSPFSPEVLRRLVAQAMRSRTPERPAAPDVQLTDREREVLKLLVDGCSNAEIAERLFLGITTVKTHLANLLTKTGSENRVRLAVFASQHPTLMDASG